MPRSKPHYLKTRNIHFATKRLLREHLQAIFHKTKNLPDKKVSDQNDILDLIDFLEDYHNESLAIQEQFELENCIFYVDKPKDYDGQCFWLMDQTTKNKRHFSFTSFGNPKTAMQNLVSCFGYMVRTMKMRIRKEIATREGKNFEDYDLWNENPKPKELVAEFLKLHNLEDKIELIVSPNGENNNAPYLMSDYEYLGDEYIRFYQEKKAKDLMTLKLKPRP